MESSDKKLQRIQNKVNKLKAFYALTHPVPSSTRVEESPDSGIDIAEPKPARKFLPPEELAVLRKRLGMQQKEKLSRPVLFQLHVPEHLTTANVRQLLLYALVGGDAPGLKPEWCTLIRWQKISQILVIAIDGMTKGDWEDYSSASPAMKNLLTNGGRLEPQPTGNLTKSLLEAPVSKVIKKIDISAVEGSLLGDYRPLPRIASDPSPIGLLGDGRVHLLMSIERLAMEKYPLPHCSISGLDTRHYIPTKDVYEPVSHLSPLFAVDCEMCMTSPRRHELTRISIVNEQLQVVYDTYVKPFNPILNYLTKYSGITKAILDPVNTRLHDVQAAVRKLLPSNAILCGQSLNGDLHALEMIHPYVIDTSVIYNLSGSARGKSSLKILSQLFLGKSIQGTDKCGHDSVEDSRTTMELVLLKLKQGIIFGDVTRGWELPMPSSAVPPAEPIAVLTVSPDLPEQASVQLTVETSTKPLEFPLKRKLDESAGSFDSSIPSSVVKMSGKQKRSVLNCASGRDGKTTCVVGTTTFVESLSSSQDAMTVHHVSSTKRAIRRTVKCLSTCDFLFTDISLDKEDDVEKRKGQISSLMKKLESALTVARDKSLCVIVLSGDDTVDKSGLEYGLCCCAVKDSTNFVLDGDSIHAFPTPDPD